MKKKVKTWILILGMATPTLFSGCLTKLGRDMRDAAIDGAADAVRDTVFERVLEIIVLPGDEE